MPSRSSIRWLALLLVAACGCSTPLSPYSASEDEESSDAGLTKPSDAGLTPVGDASPGRDARVSTAVLDCTRLPTLPFATLLTDGCRMRPSRSCAAAGLSTQQVVNLRLADLAKKCGNVAGVNVGFTLNSDGCPDQLRYDQRRLFSEGISGCLQSLLEEERFGCPVRCALIGPAATLDLN